MEIEKFNLRSKSNPKFVNIGKCCTFEEKDKFIQLLCQYIDVLAYSCVDIKYFWPKEVQHDIPLKFDAVSFKKKSNNNTIQSFQVQIFFKF